MRYLLFTLLILSCSNFTYAETKWLAPIPNPDNLSVSALSEELKNSEQEYFCAYSGCWYVITEDENTINLHSSSERKTWLKMIDHELRETPDDYFYSPTPELPGGQWSLSNPYIGWLNAWETFFENEAMPPAEDLPIIVVIDTGFGEHIDFDPTHLYKGETYGIQKIGDTYTICPSSACPDLAFDKHGHGSHVTGIIAAQTNNYLGGASVSGGRARILSINATNDAGTALANEKIFAAMDYVVNLVQIANENIVALNLSFGGYADDADMAKHGGGYMLDAQLQTLHDAGVLAIAAAANHGYNMSQTPLVDLPADFELPNVIAVMSVNSNLEKADYSNFAGTTAIAAPGQYIFSFATTYDEYVIMSGNSMATPYIAGVIAGAASLNDSLSGTELACMLMKTASQPAALDDVLAGSRMVDVFAMYDAATDPAYLADIGCYQTLDYPIKPWYDSSLPSVGTPPKEPEKSGGSSSGCSLGSSGSPHGDAALVAVSFLLFVAYRKKSLGMK